MTWWTEGAYDTPFQLLRFVGCWGWRMRGIALFCINTCATILLLYSLPCIRCARILPPVSLPRNQNNQDACHRHLNYLPRSSVLGHSLSHHASLIHASHCLLIGYLLHIYPPPPSSEIYYIHPYHCNDILPPWHPHCLLYPDHSFLSQHSQNSSIDVMLNIKSITCQSHVFIPFTSHIHSLLFETPSLSLLVRLQPRVLCFNNLNINHLYQTQTQPGPQTHYKSNSPLLIVSKPLHSTIHSTAPFDTPPFSPTQYHRIWCDANKPTCVACHHLPSPVN